ncbi:PIN domain-containing protein [Actinomyces faecalis]|uniref:PIN domain-containing protein n=1 Tax=Actinomyces faecalis TaxID=2722820 RepID=UPI001555D630|nr:PIN domain-containing protein [Actinomyces faecalis]
MSKVFLDTNILAYLFDSASPGKHAAASEALSQPHHYVVSTQVMLELYTVLTRKLSPAYSPQEARHVIQRICDFEVVNADAALVDKAMQLSATHQLSIWDSMILEAAAEAGCAVLWTEDLTSGSRLRGVTITNPLVKRA